MQTQLPLQHIAAVLLPSDAAAMQPQLQPHLWTCVAARGCWQQAGRGSPQPLWLPAKVLMVLTHVAGGLVGRTAPVGQSGCCSHLCATCCCGSLACRHQLCALKRGSFLPATSGHVCVVGVGGCARCSPVAPVCISTKDVVCVCTICWGCGIVLFACWRVSCVPQVRV